MTKPLYKVYNMGLILEGLPPSQQTPPTLFPMIRPTVAKKAFGLAVFNLRPPVTPLKDDILVV